VEDVVRGSGQFVRPGTPSLACASAYCLAAAIVRKCCLSNSEVITGLGGRKTIGMLKSGISHRVTTVRTALMSFIGRSLQQAD